MKKFFDQLYLIGELKSNGIDIYNDRNYKNTDSYSKIKDNRIFCGNNGFMTMEEYIERYLILQEKIIYNYDSIYDMGNTVELAFDDCTYPALATEIIENMDLMSKRNIDAEKDDFATKFYRTGGLVDRIKNYLTFDLELFNKNNLKHQSEIFKMLYFFYMLENKYFPKTNILALLSKPSMENVDNYFNEMRTSNGKIIQMIKSSLEKELPIHEKNKIKDAVLKVVSRWEDILEKIFYAIEHSTEYTHRVEEIIRVLQTVPENLFVNEKDIQYEHSPIETLYLKVIQHENISRINDILMINNIQVESEDAYNVPSNFIEDMKEFDTKRINVNDIKNYIKENALIIATYVYLRKDTTKEERRKIRNSTKKVCRLLNFCTSARHLINLENENRVSVLFIISCLQAIILDKSNETFKYIFHGYENQSKRHPQVQGALKNDNCTYDALKVYWWRKIEEHLYANIGKYAERKKFREVENICDSILIKILACPNIKEMLSINAYFI